MPSVQRGRPRLCRRQQRASQSIRRGGWWSIETVQAYVDLLLKPTLFASSCSSSARGFYRRSSPCSQRPPRPAHETLIVARCRTHRYWRNRRFLRRATTRSRVSSRLLEQRRHFALLIVFSSFGAPPSPPVVVVVFAARPHRSLPSRAPAPFFATFVKRALRGARTRTSACTRSRGSDPTREALPPPRCARA